MHCKPALQKIYQKFQAKTGYNIVIGVEQEFYCQLSLEDIQAEIGRYPFISGITEEKGEAQFEVQTFPFDNPVSAAEAVELIRTELHKIAEDINFSARPYPDKPASAMHVNINLQDRNGMNVFSKNHTDNDEVLNCSIAGLLELLLASIQYFAPYDAAYTRYKEHGMNAPSSVCWGGDNRTVALRIPSEPIYKEARRIEHRVPCADSNPYIVIAAIIAGIEHGVVNKLQNSYPRIFGNAFLPQYALNKLPDSLEQAKQFNHEYLNQVLNTHFSSC